MVRSRVFVALSVGVLTGAVVLGGCSSDDDAPAGGSPAPTQAPSPTPAATDVPSPTDSPSPTTDAQAAGPLPTAQSAVDAALAIVAGGAAIEGGQTDEAGRQVWYVLVRDPAGAGTELYLARDNGDLVQQRPEPVPAVAQGDLPALTAQQGLEAALGAVPGDVIEFDLGTEQGRTVWAVLVRGDNGRFEVYVDADTGEIIKQERDD